MKINLEVWASFVVFSVVVRYVNGACKAHDASWSKTVAPRVQQVSPADPTKVTVDWRSAINNARCVDIYKVLAWKHGQPQNRGQVLTFNDKTKVTAEVTVDPCIDYNFAVEFTESDWTHTDNEVSKTARFKTEAVPALVNTDPANFYISYAYDKVRKVTDLSKATVKINKRAVRHPSCLKHIEVSGVEDPNMRETILPGRPNFGPQQGGSIFYPAGQSGGSVYNQGSSRPTGGSFIQIPINGNNLHNNQGISGRSSGGSVYNAGSTSNSYNPGHTGGYNPWSTGGSSYNPGSSGGSAYNPGNVGGSINNTGSTGGSSYNSGSGSHNTGGSSYNSGGGSHYSGGGFYNPGNGNSPSGGGIHMPGSGSHNTGGSSYNSGGGSHYSGGGFYNPGNGNSYSGGGIYMPGVNQSCGSPYGCQSGKPNYQSRPNIHGRNKSTRGKPLIGGKVLAKITPPFYGDVIEGTFSVKPCTPYRIKLKLYSPRNAELGQVEVTLPRLADMRDFRPPPLSELFRIEKPTTINPRLALQPNKGVPASCLASFLEAVDSRMARLEWDLQYHIQLGQQAQGHGNYLANIIDMKHQKELNDLGCVCNSTNVNVTTTSAKVISYYNDYLGIYQFGGTHKNRPYFRQGPHIGHPRASRPHLRFIYWEPRENAWYIADTLGSNKPKLKTIAKSRAKCPADPANPKSWKYSGTITWKSDPALSVKCLR